ncbi:MAG: outer membrane beta-barrel protein [Gammaproteobacteria bacterium]|nr:outer membrane beta-barrel protein [Gammaproteobacteria bacterium]
MKATKLAIALLAATGISAIATPVMAYEAGDWLVRGRIVNVNLGVDTDVLHLNGAPVANTGVTVDNDTIPELDITYMITRNIGAELILGYSEHTVTAFGAGLADPDVIEANALPPTLILQYHFAPDSNIRPYVGAGVNYTYFFDEDTQGTFSDLGVSVTMESSWGLAAQAGVDVAINDDWFVNLDVKYIDMDTKANFSTGHSVEVDLNPIVWGVGIGRSF